MFFIGEPKFCVNNFRYIEIYHSVWQSFCNSVGRHRQGTFGRWSSEPSTSTEESELYSGSTGGQAATAGRCLRSRRQPTGDLYNSRERVVVGQAVQVLQAVEPDLSERAMPTEKDTQKHSSASRSTHTGAPGPQKAEETPPQADAPGRPSTLRSTSAVEGRPTTPTTTGGLVFPPRKPTPDMPPL